MVGAEECGGGFSLRPSREPLRPLRLIRRSGILVVTSLRYGFALKVFCLLSDKSETGGLVGGIGISPCVLFLRPRFP